jgi:peptidoglycan L-alanyl-D-glutamate endopeptidase CwlK
MPRFSQESKSNLGTAHHMLQEIMEEAIQFMDFSVLEGYRPDDRQDYLYQVGLSKKKAGESMHNRSPSWAVDIAPYPVDWEDTERFVFLAGIIFTIAKKRGIEIRWGGDWDNDKIMKDENFRDYGHFELVPEGE